MRTLLKNIKCLAGIDQETKNALRGKDLAKLNCIENAYLLIENEKISKFGKQEDCIFKADKEIDCSGKFVLPSYCDSHTHLVFHQYREGEFVDKINGLSYQEIAAKGGGILNSAEKLANASEEELLKSAIERANEIIKLGTGAVEIKSGYGLSVDAEIKILRVIKALKKISPLTIKSTFLGAHAFPKNISRTDYIALIINEMLPKIAEEKLADYIDVFCESNYFSVDEMDKILKAGAKFGLKPKVHVNQFTSIGAIENAIKNNAISVDHLEVTTENELNVLAESSTIATLLPSCSFFINIPYANARKMIDKNISVALASDFNPGSTPSGNMQLVNSLACIKQKLLPEEALNASTINGAFAMELQDLVGSIKVGKKANLNITKAISSLAILPYSFGSNSIESVILNGKIIL